MSNVLLLVHRIPYPPNKGDKIRSYHLLKYLSERHKLFLGAFVDDVDDWLYAPEVEKLCASTCLLPLNKKLATLRSLSGFLKGAALTVPYYGSFRMKRWVNDVLNNQAIDRIVVFSSSMAQYVECKKFSGIKRIIDFVDIDSDKWQQYAKTKHWPLSWVYNREFRKLQKYERRIADKFDVSTFVSSSEAKHFRLLTPGLDGKIQYYNNGVNLDFYSLTGDLVNPYMPDTVPFVFVGAMDYWANEDAVRWFTKDVLPSIRTVIPNALFYIVGSNPGRNVLALNSQEKGIIVTGKVNDVRPYLAYAQATIICLRIARGIQNKVLEAMAMECPVITTSQAIEGIDAVEDRDYLLADSADEIRNKVQILKNNPDRRKSMTIAARQMIEEKYSWSENLKLLDSWLK
ncbi:MAG: TIGR03087 family PEP-CTERM/XrtA system glycosyltransferase [Gammaproteobacteria bacterium]|nr:TIGR03087 family PEP-CTERM/XrtA system glycosyltransferase [Gammaproteobacteria bacterium]